MGEREIYVLGSINVDLMFTVDNIPQAGETLHGLDYLENLGGKGLNQVRAMHELGAKVVMLGAVGGDAMGEKVLASLRGWGISDNYIEVMSHVATGLACIIRMRAENRIILHAGANFAMTEKVLSPLLAVKPGGFFLAQLEVPYSLVLMGMKVAKTNGLTTILNLAPARLDVQDILPYVDYLIVNQRELELLTTIYPREEVDVQLAFTQLRQLGLQRLVVTLGAGGVLYVDAYQTIFVPSYRIDAVDTTGAGDAFVGAFVATLAQGSSMKDALYFANAAGAYACLHVGVEQAMGKREDIKAVMKGEKRDE